MQSRNAAVHHLRLILRLCGGASNHSPKNSRQQHHRNATCSKQTTSNARTGGHQGSMTEHNLQLHPSSRPSFAIYKESTTSVLRFAPGESTTMKTTGNTILITGGGSGIGRGLAEAFHKLGNKVIIAGRRKQVLDETTAANPGISSIQPHIEDPADIRKGAAQLAKDYPTLNVVIHNAGIMRPENLLAQPETTDAEAIITTNLL